MLTLDKAKEIVQKAKDAREGADETIDFSKSNKVTGETYTLSEVANHLKTSENRVRHWEKSYSAALSNHRNQYNHRVFTEDDVRALERIKFLQDSGLYTKQGILSRLKTNISDGGESATNLATDREYRQKLLIALNTLASEIRSLRREVREDLPGSIRRDLDHLTLLLFPPRQEKKPWWKIW